MLKVGEKAIVKNDDGGHFYVGKRVVVVWAVGSQYEKPYYVKAEEGASCSWYAEKDLEKIDEV